MDWVETENFSVQFKSANPKSYSVKIVDKIDFSDSHPFVKAYQILKDCAGDTPPNSPFHRRPCYTLWRACVM